MEFGFVIAGTVVVTATITTVIVSRFHLKKRWEMRARMNQIIDEHDERSDQLCDRIQILHNEVNKLTNDIKLHELSHRR
jgi:hypothetical protein